MSDDKLESVIARQQAAKAAAQAAEQQRAQAAANQEADLALAKTQWGQQEPVLFAALNELNTSVEASGLAIRVSTAGIDFHGDAIALKNFELVGAFGNGSKNKLAIQILTSGDVAIKCGVEGSFPGKEYGFRLAGADYNKWRDVFIDFMDVNVA